MAMDQQQSLLEEIIANPDDDTPRLIYADYLEDRGDPRGTFIRAQCFLAKSDFLCDEYYDWLEQSSLLEREHGEAWAEELKQGISVFLFHRKPKFHRGFIDEITLLASDWVEDQGAVFSKAPINWVRPNRVTEKGEALAELESLTQLRGLDFRGIKIPPKDISAILKSPHLTNLTGLKTISHMGHFGPDEIRVLAESKASKTLRHLELHGLPPNLNAITEGHGFPNLKSLVFSEQHTPREDSLGILAALNAPELTGFSLSMQLGPSDAQGLNSTQWQNLKSLNFRQSTLAPGFLSNLVDSGIIESIEKLSIEFCLVPQVELELLFVGNSLNNCRELTIDLIPVQTEDGHDNNLITETGEWIGQQLPATKRLLERMANHTQLTNLKRLSMTHLRNGGLEILMKSGVLNQLESLSIWSSELSKQDVVALANSPLAQTLKSLEIVATAIDPDAFRMLERAEFPNLIHAKFGGDAEHFNMLPHEALERLLCGHTFSNVRKLNLDSVDISLAKLAAHGNMPELRLLSQQNIRGDQEDVKALLDSDRFPKLFKLNMTGSFPAEDADRLALKFGPRLEL